MTRVISRARAFDLDDFGTQIGENLRAIGAGNILGQVNDPLA